MSRWAYQTSRFFIAAKPAIAVRYSATVSSTICSWSLTREAVVARGDQHAHGQALDVPLPRPGQRLVEVVDVEHQPPLGRGEHAEVRQVRVAAALHRQSRARRRRQVAGHDQRRAAVERERRDEHAPVADRHELGHARLGLALEQLDRIARGATAARRRRGWSAAPPPAPPCRAPPARPRSDAALWVSARAPRFSRLYRQTRGHEQRRSPARRLCPHYTPGARSCPTSHAGRSFVPNGRGEQPLRPSPLPPFFPSRTLSERWGAPADIWALAQASAPGHGSTLAAIVAGLVVLLFAGCSGAQRHSEAAGARSCEGAAALCGRRLDEVVFPGTHNSFAASAEPGWYFANQRYGISRQLDDGIRALLIDVHFGVYNPATGRVRTDLRAEGSDRNKVAAAGPRARPARRRPGRRPRRGGHTERHARALPVPHAVRAGSRAAESGTRGDQAVSWSDIPTRW